MSTVAGCGVVVLWEGGGRVGCREGEGRVEMKRVVVGGADVRGGGPRLI